MDACELLRDATPLDLAVLARKVELNTVARLAAAADVAAWTPPSPRIPRRATQKRVLPRNRRLRRFSMSPTAATASKKILPFEEPLPPRRRLSLAPLPRASTYTAPLRLNSLPESSQSFASTFNYPQRRHAADLISIARALDFSQLDMPQAPKSAQPRLSRHTSDPDSTCTTTNLFDNLQLSALPRCSTFTSRSRSPNWPPRKMLPLRKRISYLPKPPTPSSASPLDEWGDLVALPFSTPSPKKQRCTVPLDSPCDVRAIQF